MERSLEGDKAMEATKTIPNYKIEVFLKVAKDILKENEPEWKSDKEPFRIIGEYSELIKEAIQLLEEATE